jgi:hypothetical protein
MAKNKGTGKPAGAARTSTAKKKAKTPESPQLKKDPVFMKNLEAAIAGESARPSRPVAVPKTMEKPVQATARAQLPKKAAEPAKPGKPARGQSPASAIAALAAELTSLIPQLDAEGLAFLIEQARVHLYNMRVTELESAAEDAERASTRAASLRTSGKATAGGARALKAATGHDDDFTIKAASDGSAYDLVWQGKWKMFTGEEMLAMVRIASNKDPVDQVAGRLYRWFSAERSDVFQDIPFSGLADPKLKQLVTLLRNTFKVKGGKRA